jgi:RimJ/RimL family protein N-acetyltransferase
MSATPEIQTLRLILEPIRSAHAEEAWPHVDDARMWTYFTHLRPASILDLRRQYAKWERGSPTADEVWWNWLCRERTSGMLTGAMQATVFPEERVAYVAYAIYPERQRKGYAYEAVRALIERVRATFGITRFLAEMDARNEPSYRLAETLGFTRVQSRDGEFVYELNL